MTAQNRLIVTAAILQGPVFNAKADAADKFGSFGGLVGHELTRAIDAKGALVDAKGELRSWWTPADKTAGPCSAPEWPRSTAPTISRT